MTLFTQIIYNWNILIFHKYSQTLIINGVVEILLQALEESLAREAELVDFIEKKKKKKKMVTKLNDLNSHNIFFTKTLDSDLIIIFIHLIVFLHCDFLQNPFRW